MDIFIEHCTRNLHDFSDTLPLWEHRLIIDLVQKRSCLTYCGQHRGINYPPDYTFICCRERGMDWIRVGVDEHGCIRDGPDHKYVQGSDVRGSALTTRH
jgi:hypothetical protein